MENGLLSVMSRDDRALLEPHFTLVELELKQPLFDAHQPIDYVYFFLSGLSSEIATVGRENIEVGCVGREGLSGHAVLLDVECSPHYAFMQGAGTALRIRSCDLVRMVDQSSSLRKLLSRYVHVFMTQIAQSALADGRFTLQQRLARWLLMCQDRLGNQMPLTHEFLALMLGVRRPGVTTAMHVLEGEHLIKAERASITILDRPGLIATAGGSYGLPEEEYRRLINRAF
ncbi:Crp/Fnr family transcriptional regulator [Rhizobium sp. NFR03]|uniref:Crp/Fnr family transcriptional regulator n=1 Tax=Rhizobium sp. NFR03 TaxID=1566263 RepID=UPI0008CCE0C0|nr:Crp/Fnr family transcriptional regulator [Rhizobium sp. NFR03]SES42687.1 cAMP-binding domain of CRP or a regulatory subunit of cAMP-dependent protein kinases [Rhizobium sp. NFR03]